MKAIEQACNLNGKQLQVYYALLPVTNGIKLYKCRLFATDIAYRFINYNRLPKTSSGEFNTVKYN